MLSTSNSFKIQCGVVKTKCRENTLSKHKKLHRIKRSYHQLSCIKPSEEDVFSRVGRAAQRDPLALHPTPRVCSLLLSRAGRTGPGVHSQAFGIFSYLPPSSLDSLFSISFSTNCYVPPAHIEVFSSLY